jgi:glutamate dehydrogenase/glutamate dehydrogenase (NAD(P)+)
VPDILANAGGVIASMLEYSSSLSAIKPSQAQVYEVLKTKIGENLDLAVERAKSAGASLAHAAVELAVERVYAVMKGRRMI